MAKKHNEDPVYPAVPLVIPREEFVELLTTQIEKGKALLDVSVPIAGQRDPYGYTHLSSDRVYYDETAQNDFLASFTRWHERNKEIYRASFSDPNSIYFHDYEKKKLDHLIIVDIIKNYKDDIARLNNQMQTDIERIDLIRCVVPKPNTEDIAAQSKAVIKDKKRVFVVHGHDTNVRNEVELFVRSIGYEPIILCKRADKGDTIIEKIEREAKDVCYAIVIYTSCDLGKDKNDSDLKPRARQNVVFEHGFMCAYLGRTHVCALLEDGVEQPGDLKGVIYKPLDTAGAWKYLIADEMKAVGLDVDKNKI
ncbi:MAG: nucleotide-binding protein [Bacteroidales bacterium]|nr:nucleotide-binding protein [Bacteroidales bacterium]